MKETRVYFWLGVAVASLFTIVVTQTAAVEAISRSFLLGKLPRELRLGIDLGILSQKEVESRGLDTPISRGAFADKLQKTLLSLGLNTLTSRKAVANAGIFEPSPSRPSLSRRQALEGLSRAVIHLAAQSLITLDEGATVSFADFKPDQKYGPALRWLQEKSILQGYPDGTIKGSRAITTRETVYLLYRLYESISKSRMLQQSGDNLMFMDLPLDDPILPALKELAEAGAFTHTGIRPTFSGNAPVVWADMVLMLKGILEKQGVKSDDFFADATSKGHAQRQHMAMALATFYKYLGTSLQASPGQARFHDVKPNSQLQKFLDTLAAKDLHLGYPNGRFAPAEFVTWYEWVGVAKAAMERVDIIRPIIQKSNYASREDFERFAAVLQAKRLRVRQILNRELAE